MSGNFYGGQFFGGGFFGAVDAQASAGYRVPHTVLEEQIHRARIQDHEAASEVIASVAAQQAAQPDKAAAKQARELRQALKLRQIEWDVAYLESLNEARQALITSEISRRLRQKMDEEEALIALLLSGAAA